MTGEKTALADAARMALSRLVLARASMRSALNGGGENQLEGWLLAEKENGWIDEIKAALDAAEKPKPVVRLKTQEVIDAVANCPTPMFHETHRYCPSCPWTEEWS